MITPLPTLNWPRSVSLLLAVYWVALTISTHVPQLPVGGGHIGDKTAHYIAYAGLAFLLCWTWTTRHDFALKGALLAFGVAAAYGAIDELSQIPVPGRVGEWNDWLADMLGAATGICLFWALNVLRRLAVRRAAGRGGEAM